MDSLSKDLLFNIATMLDLNDLLHLCYTNQRINKLVCSENTIWLYKLARDFPSWKTHFDNKNPKKVYILLVNLKKVKSKLKYPGSIYELYNVKIISLVSKKIREIPPEIKYLYNLEQLYIGGNYIKEIPAEIGKLQKLRFLYLNGNKIEKIPPEIGDLEKLEILYLDNNKIKEIPSEIGKLKQLIYLNLKQNLINSLPIEIKNLTNLKDLYFDETVIIPNELKDMIYSLQKHVEKESENDHEDSGSDDSDDM